ncbi:MAG: hypothetical protein WC967_11555 [Balneolaceae bacterium]
MRNRKPNKYRHSGYRYIRSEILENEVIESSIPYQKWVQELHEVPDQKKGNEYSARLNWIAGKLKDLGIEYTLSECPFGSRYGMTGDLNYTQYLLASFIDYPDKPVFTILVPIGGIADKDEKEPFSNPTGAVQLIMLAEKLKQTQNPINTHLVFVDSDDLEHAPNHIFEEINTREIPGLMASMLVLGRFAGMGICQEQDMFTEGCFTFGGPFSDEFSDTEYGGFRPYRLFSGFWEHNYQVDYDVTFLHADLSEEFTYETGNHSEFENGMVEEDYNGNQLKFVQTEGFIMAHENLYKGVLRVNKHHLANMLDTYFKH